MKARDNPLAAWRVERVKYRQPGLTVEDLVRRFDALGRRAALVGGHGTGKTTLLEELAAYWERAGARAHRLRLTVEQPRLRPDGLASMSARLDRRDIILLDGAEQLSWWHWRLFRRATRNAGGVLITCHRPGRLPTLLECRTSPELLAELVTELAPDLGLAGAAPWAELFQRHRGNLRAALRELYDLLATR